MVNQPRGLYHFDVRKVEPCGVLDLDSGLSKDIYQSPLSYFEDQDIGRD